MEINRKLSLIVAYYLARFDLAGLKNLGYKNWKTSFLDISNKLKVKEHSVRNWRDEFDPLFGFRAGWYQRPMSPSRTNVALALENLNESDLRTIVIDILSGVIHKDTINLNQLLSIVDESSKKEKDYTFILRGPTGKKAEQFFIDYYRINNYPLAGKLIDTRDLGCGYDFEIVSGGSKHFVEVKGLANNDGGILFTNKEWEKAKQEKDKYSVCLVSNLNETPKISFINNPFKKLEPRKNIIHTVQVNWSVSNIELKEFNE